MSGDTNLPPLRPPPNYEPAGGEPPGVAPRPSNLYPDPDLPPPPPDVTGPANILSEVVRQDLHSPLRSANKNNPQGSPPSQPIPARTPSSYRAPEEESPAQPTHTNPVKLRLVTKPPRFSGSFPHMNRPPSTGSLPKQQADPSSSSSTPSVASVLDQLKKDDDDDSSGDESPPSSTPSTIPTDSSSSSAATATAPVASSSSSSTASPSNVNEAPKAQTAEEKFIKAAGKYDIAFAHKADLAKQGKLIDEYKSIVNLLHEAKKDPTINKEYLNKIGQMEQEMHPVLFQNICRDKVASKNPNSNNQVTKAQAFQEELEFSKDVKNANEYLKAKNPAKMQSKTVLKQTADALGKKAQEAADLLSELSQITPVPNEYKAEHSKQCKLLASAVSENARLSSGLHLQRIQRAHHQYGEKNRSEAVKSAKESFEELLKLRNCNDKNAREVLDSASTYTNVDLAIQQAKKLFPELIALDPEKE